MDTELGRSTPEGTVFGENTGPQRPMQVPQCPALTCYMLPSLSQAVHFPLVLAAKFFFFGERGFIASKTSISSPRSHHTKEQDPAVQHVSRTPRSNTPCRLMCPVGSPVNLPPFPASGGRGAAADAHLSDRRSGAAQ